MQHCQKKKRGFLLLASENCQGVLLADSSQLSVPMEKIGRLPWVKRTTSLKVLPHFQGSPFPMTDYCGAKGPSSLPPTPNLGPLWRLTLELLKGQFDLCWEHHSSTLPCFTLLPPFPFHWCPFWEHFLLNLLHAHLYLRVWFPRNLRTSPVTLLILKF